MLLFSLPLVAGSVFQQLYNTADFIFVGNLVGKNAAAAVGASGILVTCLIGLFTGIAVGTGVVVSQDIGARNGESVRECGHTAVTLAVVMGILLTLVGELGAVAILKFMHTPGEIMPEAVAYIRLYFLGMLPMILYNVGSGILRACGDSRSPFYVLAAGGFLNVCADWLCIAVLGMGVRGAAIATTVSQSFSAVMILAFLLRGNQFFQLKVSALCVSRKSLGRILANGLPAGIQAMVITLSNMVVQYHINGYGTSAVAAFATYYKLENFTYMPVLAFGSAVTTFAGQNYGAGKMDRVRKGARVAAILSSLIVAALAFFLLAIGHTALGWFVKDEEVIHNGLLIIGVTFPLYWMNSLIEVLSGTLRGLGRSLTSMVMILATLCGLRVLVITILDLHFHDIRILATVYPISWGAAILCLYASCRMVQERAETLAAPDNC